MCSRLKAAWSSKRESDNKVALTRAEKQPATRGEDTAPVRGRGAHGPVLSEPRTGVFLKCGMVVWLEYREQDAGAQRPSGGQVTQASEARVKEGPAEGTRVSL